MLGEYSIINHSLVSSNSNDAITLFSNTSMGIRNEVVAEIVDTVGGDSQTKKYSYFPVEYIQGEDSFSRLFQLITNSLQPLITDILSKQYESDIHLHCILPNACSARSQFINRNELELILKTLFGKRLPFTLSTSYISEGAANALQLSCKKNLLNDNALLVFGGVDSLIERQTIAELLKSKSLLTDTASCGVIPGEASAFIVIQKTVESEFVDNTIYLSGISSGVDSEISEKENDLLTSIYSALSQATIATESISNVVYSSNMSLSNSVQWHYTCQQLWPNVLPENLRIAIQLGEINEADNPEEHNIDVSSSQLSLGDCGAANLALELIYSIGKLKFNKVLSNNKIKNIEPLLVCDNHSHGKAGAICLQIKA